jgi:hypothetical protein
MTWRERLLELTGTQCRKNKGLAVLRSIVPHNQKVGDYIIRLLWSGSGGVGRK